MRSAKLPKGRREPRRVVELPYSSTLLTIPNVVTAWNVATCMIDACVFLCPLLSLHRHRRCSTTSSAQNDTDDESADDDDGTTALFVLCHQQSTVMSQPLPFVGCLTIAGSDSGGGAGIQADLKTFAALNAFGTSAITAVTSQDTEAVHAVHIVPVDHIIKQIEVTLLDTLNVCAIKTGMLPDEATVAAVAATIQRCRPGMPLVVDPVMISKGGSILTPQSSIDAMKHKLLPIATVVTPNVPEAEALTGMTIQSYEEMLQAGFKILEQSPGCKAVLMKGGHAAFREDDGAIVDVLILQDKSVHHISNPRIHTKNSHGTGCTLSAAIAVKLAFGLPIHVAVDEAASYLHEALKGNANRVQGRGHGPVHHFWNLWSGAADDRVRTGNSFFYGVVNQIPKTISALREHRFIAAMAKGTLTKPCFIRYLVQDEHYLNVFIEALKVLVALAPTWGKDASTQLLDACLAECTAFSEFEDASSKDEQSEACRNYIAFLKCFMAEGHTFEEVACAVTPCFWSYWDIAEYTKAKGNVNVTFKCWIDYYSDAIAKSAATTSAWLVDQCRVRLPTASAAVTEQKLAGILVEAFVHEVHFFDEACALTAGIYASLPDVWNDQLAAMRYRLAEDFYSQTKINAVVEILDAKASYAPQQLPALLSAVDVAELDSILFDSIRPLTRKWPKNVHKEGLLLHPDDVALLHGFGVPRLLCSTFLFSNDALLSCSASTLDYFRAVQAKNGKVNGDFTSSSAVAVLAYCCEPALFPPLTNGAPPASFQLSSETVALFHALQAVSDGAALSIRSLKPTGADEASCGYSESMSDLAATDAPPAFIRSLMFGPSATAHQLYCDALFLTQRVKEGSIQERAAVAWAAYATSVEVCTWVTKGQDDYVREKLRYIIPAVQLPEPPTPTYATVAAIVKSLRLIPPSSHLLENRKAIQAMVNQQVGASNP